MKNAHMLAVLGAEVARPPQGLHFAEEHLPRYPSREMVEAFDADCQRILDANYAACDTKSRKLHMVGKGCGFSMESSPYCCHAEKDGVHVCMIGEVSNWGTLDAVSMSHNAFVRNEPPAEANDAAWLLDFYKTFTIPEDEEDEVREGIMDKALEWLSRVQGSFAFVIYDSVRHQVLAARDREGTCPLYWGATAKGQLLIGSLLRDLEEAEPTATAFPAGCIFTSQRKMLAYSPGERGWLIAGDDVPGELVSFVAADDAVHFRGVKAIPRITSKGMVCGAVYKVSSAADMTHSLAQH